MVCRDTGNPAREGKRRVVGCQFSPGPEKHFMRRVFCSIKRIQKVAAKAENATIVRLVDVVVLFVEGRLGFHWGLHAVPSWYYGWAGQKLHSNMEADRRSEIPGFPIPNPPYL